MLDMRDYNPAARRYWWFVTTLGFLALVHSLYGMAHLERGALVPALVGIAFAALAGCIPVRLPGAKTSIAAGEIFIFLLLLMFGPAVAVVAAAVEGAVASFRTSKRWTSRLGTPAMASMAMVACGWFFGAMEQGLRAQGAGEGSAILALMGFAALYFCVNTLLPSLLIALKRDEPLQPLQSLLGHGWILLAYLAHASIAGLLFMAYGRFGAAGLLVAIPLIGMFVSTLHFHYQRKESDRRHMAELEESETRFHSAFAHAAIGMSLLSGDRRVFQANTAFCGMLGYDEAQMRGFDLLELVDPQDVPALDQALAPLLAEKVQEVRLEVRGRHREGATVWLALAISLARSWKLKDQHLILQAHDVSERKLAEAKLQHEATHDNLTQLPNRRSFNDTLARTFARWQRHPERLFAVMYLDFDRFKLVNDSLGHKAGDELLCTVARRLQATLRPTDTVARLGGDEFAIIVEDLQRERDVLDLCERLQVELHRPMNLMGLEFTTSASIGVTFSSNDYQDTEQIVRDADLAMYKAKANGRNQYAVYDASLHQRVATQLALENDLRHAFDDDQFFLEYQPIYSLQEDRLVGFEALARWRHPERGVLLPGDFIGPAEETGLIVPIGAALLEKACLQMKAWNAPPELRISVNVSSMQFRHPEFIAHVSRALHKASLQPSQLMLEVTESVLMEGNEAVLNTLRILRRMGVFLGLDDFGTGYSSLGYLASLPIDALKLDRTFIDRMSQGRQGSEVVRAIFALGAALDLKVFAEGIESPAQLALLENLKCEYAQGYLLARPLSAEAAGARIERSLTSRDDAVAILQGRRLEVAGAPRAPALPAQAC